MVRASVWRSALARLHRLLVVAVSAFALGDFFVNWMIDICCGGQATEGYVAGDQWYLGGHGIFMGVSAPIWILSDFSAGTLEVAWLAMAIGIVSLMLVEYRRGISGRLSRDAAAARVAAVTASGHERASRRDTGAVGGVWFAPGLVRITAYPGGVVLKPFFGRPRAILASEVAGLEIGVTAGQPRLELHHAAVDLRSPLTVVEHADAPLGAALVALATGHGEAVDPPTASRPPVLRVPAGIFLALQPSRLSGRAASTGYASSVSIGSSSARSR